MSNLKSEISNPESPNSVSSVAKSFHHRMARLIRDSYWPKCMAPGCERAAEYVCEWDSMRFKKAVTGQKLYCAEHAGNFALKHGIYMTGLPDVALSQLEQADREGWRYADSSYRSDRSDGSDRSDKEREEV